MILIATELKSTNHNDAPVNVRVDTVWKELGVIAGGVAIYIPLSGADKLVEAINMAKIKAAQAKLEG